MESAAGGGWLLAERMNSNSTPQFKWAVARFGNHNQTVPRGGLLWCGNFQRRRKNRCGSCGLGTTVKFVDPMAFVWNGSQSTRLVEVSMRLLSF